MMGRTALRISALLLVIVGCTSTSEPPTTTSTSTTLPPATTTTEPERCPDVFCLLYEVKEGLFWSDGQPLTPADFVHTLDILLDPSGPDTGNPGYQLISDYELVDETTLLVAMSEVFPAWRTLFEIVYPAHADYDPVVPGPTAGPFRIARWVDDEIVLERNQRFVGPESGGDVEELIFTLGDGTRQMIADLENGSIDVIRVIPQDWSLDEIRSGGGIVHTLSPGPFWEQITFNHDDPLLAQPFFRMAIATALDREQILDATVRTLDPSVAALGSTVWMSQSAYYRDHFTVSPDIPRARQILTDNGCELGGDGVFVCDGRRASFIWATTTGDPFRAEKLRQARQMLTAAGIEVQDWALDPSDLFSTPIFFGDANTWQIMSFAWKASADPFLGESMYRCFGEGPHGMGLLNAARHCDPQIDALLAEAGGTLDPGRRADILNQVDELFLGDFAMIPLYQRPNLLAWSDELDGPQANPWQTETWNVGAWSGLNSVTFALDRMPTSLTTPLTDDDTRLVMTAIHAGAYMVNPAMEYVPVLVERVQTIVRGG